MQYKEYRPTLAKQNRADPTETAKETPTLVMNPKDRNKNSLQRNKTMRMKMKEMKQTLSPIFFK